MKGSDSIGLGKPFILLAWSAEIRIQTQWLNSSLICVVAAPMTMEKSKNKDRNPLRVWNAETQDKTLCTVPMFQSSLLMSLKTLYSSLFLLLSKTLESRICMCVLLWSSELVYYFASCLFCPMGDCGPTFSSL